MISWDEYRSYCHEAAVILDGATLSLSRFALSLLGIDERLAAHTVQGASWGGGQ